MRRRRRRLKVYVDGAIGDGRVGTGVGAVVEDGDGRILAWANRGFGPMTNNEAEYAGLVLGLEMAARYRPGEVHVYCDSEVVVNQMKGHFSVRSRALKGWHRRACEEARALGRVTYTHIPRERNRLADALAAEALQGHLVHGP
jgi:ribonuclease HI